MGNHGMSREAAGEVAERKLKEREGVAGRVERLLARAGRLGIPAASHDDDSPQRIEAMLALGVRMSEFPINPERRAPRASGRCRPSWGAQCTARQEPERLDARHRRHPRRRGQHPVFGLPAVDAGAFGLCRRATGRAATVARARHGDRQSGVRLRPGDRGGLIPACAPTVAVATVAGQPLVTHTWSAGRLVFAAGYAAAAPVRPQVALEAA